MKPARMTPAHPNPARMTPSGPNPARPTPARRRAALSLAGAAVLAAALTACSGGGSGDGLSAKGGPHGARPADACSMLTSDQVSSVVGTPGPFTGAEEDPAEDGSPVWGCTWGTPRSYADVREITAARYAQIPHYDDLTVTRLHGIGTEALLQRRKDDGGYPYVDFRAGGRAYQVEVVVDRRELGTDHPDAEAAADQKIARALAAALTP